MTMARKLLVDVSVTRFYHCISRCVRKAFLCGEGCEHRKQWLEDRLELLAENFAVSVCGFSLMDNHGLVHEVAEGTAGSASQQRGRLQRHVLGKPL